MLGRRADLESLSTSETKLNDSHTICLQNQANRLAGGGALPPQAQCSHCKEFRPRSAFYGDTSQANGLRPHCR